MYGGYGYHGAWRFLCCGVPGMHKYAVPGSWNIFCSTFWALAAYHAGRRDRCAASSLPFLIAHACSPTFFYHPTALPILQPGLT